MAITAALATPARWISNGTTDTSASFNVEAGDLLCVYIVADGPTDASYTPSNSGAALPWAKQVNVFATGGSAIEWWTAYSATARTGVTVSVVASTAQWWRWGIVKVKGSRAPVAATIPGVPTIGTATAASSTSASVTFTPGSTGGATPTYEALSIPGGLTGTSSGSPITISGLTTGTSYTFEVRARNSAGVSAYSAASNSVTPVAVSGGDVTVVGSAAWITAVTASSTGTNDQADSLYPHGVPSSYDWSQGVKYSGWSPGVANSVDYGDGNGTAWAQLYLSTIGSLNSCTFDVVNFSMYFRISGVWQKVQWDNIDGGAYVEDFSGNSSVGINMVDIANGTRGGPLSSGNSWHFWDNPRFQINPGAYDGWFIVVLTVTQNGTGGPYCAAVGGDFYLNAGANYPDNSDFGISRHMRLYPGVPKVIGLTNMTAAQLTASHPTS